MKSYIETLYDKFSIKDHVRHVVMVPLQDENSTILGAKEPIHEGKFDYRSAVGSIQWCATVARPDIARPINLMAKWNNETPTKSRVTAVRKMIAYLYETREYGITYSPNSEELWKKQTCVDGKENKIRRPKCGLDLYTDASWATEIENSYSVSGMAITAYGTVIAWKSCRQTIRAESTCTAEYIAAADGLQWCSNFGHLEFFDTPAVSEGGLPKDLSLFMDSTAAIQVARSEGGKPKTCLLYTSPSPRDRTRTRMPSSA